jgi:hypothetical protein
LSSKPLERFLWFDLKTSDDVFLVEPQNQIGGGFLSLGIKTDRYGLVIYVSKSPCRFFGLVLRTNHALVCRLCHKTDGSTMAWDTRQDLAVCFTWKQVCLGFFSLASRLAEARRWVVHVTPSRRLHWSQVKYGQVDTWCYVRPCYLCFTFSFYYVIVI